MEMRNCKICGKLFVPKCNNHFYCSKECRKEGDRLTHKAYRERHKGEKKAKIKRRFILDKALVNISNEARKHGMTYGQYVAMMEYGMK